MSLRSGVFRSLVFKSFRSLGLYVFSLQVFRSLGLYVFRSLGLQVFRSFSLQVCVGLQVCVSLQVFVSGPLANYARVSRGNLTTEDQRAFANGTNPLPLPPPPKAPPPLPAPPERCGSVTYPVRWTDPTGCEASSSSGNRWQAQAVAAHSGRRVPMHPSSCHGSHSPSLKIDKAMTLGK